jgi:excisionase family DNA binding protein
MSSNIKITRICQHCGHEFVAKTTVTKYCGEHCAKRAYKARIKKQKVEKSEIETQKQRNSPSVSTRTLEYLTVKEVASSLQCDPRTIYDMIREGRLNAINLSVRKIRVMKKDVDALFCNQSHTNPPQNVSVAINKQPAVKDCYTMGEILSKYGLAEATLRGIISSHAIHKYRIGKFVYVSKQAIDPILKRFIIEDS